MVPPNGSAAIEAEGLVKTYPTRCARARRRRSHGRAGLHPRPARSERRRQVDNRQDPDHAVPTRFGQWRASWATTSSAGPMQVRRSIGVVGQTGAVDPEATGRENMLLQGAAVRHGRQGTSAPRRRPARDVRPRRVRRPHRQDVVGGNKRKLDVATGLIHAPGVLFLDEPTTGLDPEARSELWAEVRRLNADGLTILLTTHYLEEADQLADRGRDHRPRSRSSPAAHRTS